MKLVLKKNHEKNGVLYLEGEEIEVTEDEYNFIIGCYMAERKAQLEELEKVEAPIVEHFAKKGKK